jgi:hypothetical protein
MVAVANNSGALQNCVGFIDDTKIAIARAASAEYVSMDFSKTSMCAFLAATSFRRRMSASFVHFLCATTGAPTADDETVTMSHRFGTTTVTDSESLKVVVSASDKLRRSIKANSAYRAGRQENERDDEVPHREAGWRAGRRVSDSNRGGEVARRGASDGWRNSLLIAGNRGKLPKSYRNCQ